MNNINNIAFLQKYAQMSGIPIDVLLSIYLVVKDDLFFVLDLLQRRNVKFPSLRGLKKEFHSTKQFCELSADKYTVRNSRGCVVVKSVPLLEVGDVLIFPNKEIQIEAPIVELLGHSYLVTGGNNA